MKIKETYEGRGDTKGKTFVLLESREFELAEKPAIAAIYETSDGNHEVVVIRQHEKDVKIKDRVIAEAGGAKYPSTSEWGTYGWTYQDINGARNKLNALLCKAGKGGSV